MNKAFLKITNMASKIKAQEKWKDNSKNYSDIDMIKPNRHSSIGFYSTREQMELRPRRHLMTLVQKNNIITGPDKV